MQAKQSKTCSTGASGRRSATASIRSTRRSLGDGILGGPFTVDEQAAIATLRDGNAVPYDSKPAIDALKARGIIRECNGGRRNGSFELDVAVIASLVEPLTTWLPNVLIDGAADEVPPVELIRRTI